MKKILKSGMMTGLAIMAIPVPGIKDTVISILQKIFDIDNVTVQPIYCFIFGLILFMICLVLYINYNNKERIINIVGFGNNEYWEKNNKNVKTIDVRDWNKKKDKNAFIKKKIKEIDGYINKYLASGLSYTSIAPIPIVALFGTHFSKIKINEYYEYENKSSKVKKLNNNLIFPKLRLEVTNKNSNENYALISVSTTANIVEHQYSQFGDCLHYKNRILKPHQNAIYSKKQLFNYSNKIIEQINKISSNEKIKKIYIIFATQSPLPFEVGKQINERIAKEVIVCHYQNDSLKPYEWGIVLNGKNKEKYIDMKGE